MNITLILFLIASFLITNKQYEFSFSDKDYLSNEILAIKNNSIESSNYKFPYKAEPNSVFLNLLKDSKKSSLHPILGLRYSNNSFEIFPDYIQSDLLWITPGVEFNYNQSFSLPFMSSPLLQVQNYFRFNKHSAFGFNENQVDKDMLMFPYNPKYSNEVYFLSKKPNNGIDFDEGEGAIAIITPFLDLLLGKFRTKLGPFMSGNLSISNQAPGLPQFQIRTKSNKLDFTFIVGELYSNLFETLNSDSEDDFSIKKIKRYIVNHRIDLKVKENFRIGFYEQVIVGHNLSFLYLIPTMPFWSAQHSLGDTDNLQMGIDFEYLINNNRFYSAFLMDEWAPFDTFNSDHHNWFGLQLGFSRLFNDRILMKTEYTRIEPQVYTHNESVNLPYHYNYPIGYWSGGDSEDVFIKMFYPINNSTDFTLNIRHTIMGNPIYSYESTEFLSTDNLKKRLLMGMTLNKIVNSRIGPIEYVFSMENIISKNIYTKNNFINCEFSILYNINY